MAWLTAQIKGQTGLFRISDSDYLIKDGVLYAFTTLWPDRTINHWVLNPSKQRVKGWGAHIDEIIDSIPKPVRNFGPLLMVPAGLRWGGPAGAAVGAAGMGATALYGFWRNARHRHDEEKDRGYHDRDTLEQSAEFKSPLRLLDITVRTDIAT